MILFREILVCVLACLSSSAILCMDAKAPLENRSEKTYSSLDEHVVSGPPDNLVGLKQSIISQSSGQIGLTTQKDIIQHEDVQAPTLDKSNPLNQPEQSKQSIFVSKDATLVQALKNPNQATIDSLMPSIRKYLFSHPEMVQSIFSYEMLSRLTPGEQEEFYGLADTMTKIGLLKDKNLYDALIILARSLRFTLEDQAIPESNQLAFKKFMLTALEKPDFLKSFPQDRLIAFDAALKDLFRGPAYNQNFIRLRPLLGFTIRKINAELERQQ